MSQQIGMKDYMKGAALLTVAALIVKVLSAVYRVPFQNLVGDEGFYIYQQVYPFIAIFVVWTANGFAVAISKILADNDVLPNSVQREARRAQIQRIIFFYLTALAVVFFIVLYNGAGVLAFAMGDSELAPLLQTGAFVVFVMPAFAVVKGAYQSRGLMAPIAVAQVVEQAVRVAIILCGTWYIMHTTASLYTAGRVAVSGTVIGEITGLALLIVLYRKYMPKQIVSVVKINKWQVIKELTLLSISVSMSSLILLFYQLVDSFTIYSLLEQMGMPQVVAKETKGIYDRGQPLVQLGLVIASALALAIVPLVAQYGAKKEGGRDADNVIRLTHRVTLLFSVAATVGLICIMPQINTMLFKTDALSNVLMLYVVQIIPLSIILTFTAVLQGFNKLKLPAILLLLGFMIKIIGNAVLVPNAGVLGAAFANIAGLSLSAIGLVIYLKRLIPQLADAQFYRHLASSTILMIIAISFWQWLLQISLPLTISSRVLAIIVTLTSVAVGAGIFIISIAKQRLLTEKEWFLLPLGRRMAAFQLWINQK